MIVKDTVRDVPLEEASQHIAGFCFFIDWSARDIQGNEMRVALAHRARDFANTSASWITTPEELEQFREGDRYALEMSVAINGEVVGTDNLRNMSWSFEEMLSIASRRLGRHAERARRAPHRRVRCPGSAGRERVGASSSCRCRSATSS